MSLDSRVAGLPYESSSFATPAVRLVNQKEGPFMGRLRAYFDQLAHPMQDVHSGTITHAYCRVIYEESVSRCFILPPLSGEVRRSRIGGGERSEPIRRMLFMPYNIESQSRNADFISIARRAIRNPRPEGPSNLRTLRPIGPVNLKNPFYTTLFHNPSTQPAADRRPQPSGRSPVNPHTAGVSQNSI